MFVSSSFNTYVNLPKKKKYRFNPLTFMDLIPLPFDERVSSEGNHKSTGGEDTP